MSNVNIKRAVENIKSGTTVYSPIVEVIVNAIEAIEEKKETNGEIEIVVERSRQTEIDGNIPTVESFAITDNGIGFNDANREAFDTLYTDKKISKGGKGFGRFVCLKYFKNVNINSIYQDGDAFKNRTFYMGKQNEIIVNEKVASSESTTTGTTVGLSIVQGGRFPDKKLQTIAKYLVEKILPFFISDDYKCPRIVITEDDKSNSIILNDSVTNELSAVIKEIVVKNSSFSLMAKSVKYDFNVRIFKFYYPKNLKSKISLVAHNREVTDIAIHHYIPEFIDEFYDKIAEGDKTREKNYIIKAYVFGDYLDQNVSFERGGFEFHKDNDLLLGISQKEIEKAASVLAKNAVGDEINDRKEKKKASIKKYVDECAPWHKDILKSIELTNIPYNPTDEEIESRLQKEKYKQEVSIKRQVEKLLADSDVENLKTNVGDIVRKISGTSKNDLVHYIALRRNVLDIFRKGLEVDKDGNYSSEGVVHDIIFPRGKNSDITSFKDHNLWIIDERQNFNDYVSSDLPLNGPKTERPDLLVYNKRVLFRGDNEPSNPVTIFEFKRPQRDDFVNFSSKEDPVEQIVRYVNSIKDGDYITPQGRKILVAENTPFYGYVVCDLTKKVEKWLHRQKQFKPMPDRLGWYNWFENINLYIEVLSWDKVLKDAEMRNKIFFHKLGI